MIAWKNMRVQYFPSHSSQFIHDYYFDMHLREKAGQTPAKSWSDKELAMFNGLYIKALLAQKYVM